MVDILSYHSLLKHEWSGFKKSQEIIKSYPNESLLIIIDIELEGHVYWDNEVGSIHNQLQSREKPIRIIKLLK